MKNKNIINYVLITVFFLFIAFLFSPSGQSLILNNFNNSLTSEQLNFTGVSSIVRYLELPNSAIVSDASIVLNLAQYNQTINGVLKVSDQNITFSDPGYDISLPFNLTLHNSSAVTLSNNSYYIDGNFMDFPIASNQADPFGSISNYFEFSYPNKNWSNPTLYFRQYYQLQPQYTTYYVFCQNHNTNNYDTILSLPYQTPNSQTFVREFVIPSQCYSNISRNIQIAYAQSQGGLGNDNFFDGSYIKGNISNFSSPIRISDGYNYSNYNKGIRASMTYDYAFNPLSCSSINNLFDRNLSTFCTQSDAFDITNLTFTNIINSSLITDMQLTFYFNHSAPTTGRAFVFNRYASTNPLIEYYNFSNSSWVSTNIGITASFNNNINSSYSINVSYSPNMFSNGTVTFRMIRPAGQNLQLYGQIGGNLFTDAAKILDINLDLKYTKFQSSNINLTSKLNSSNCNCQGCVLTGNTCAIPYNFTSLNSGNMTYSDVATNYIAPPAMNYITPSYYTTNNNFTLNCSSSGTSNVTSIKNYLINASVLSSGSSNLAYFIDDDDYNSKTYASIPIASFGNYHANSVVIDFNHSVRVYNFTLDYSGGDIYNTYLAAAGWNGTDWTELVYYNFPPNVSDAPLYGISSSYSVNQTYSKFRYSVSGTSGGTLLLSSRLITNETYIIKITNSSNNLSASAINNFVLPYDGQFNYQCFATDSNNLNSSISNGYVTLDTTNPVLNLSQQNSDGNYISINYLNLTANYSDANLANITFRLYNSNQQLINSNAYNLSSSNSSSSNVFSNIVAGNYYFDAIVYDLANNYKQTAKTLVRFDNNSITLRSPTNNSATGVNVTFVADYVSATNLKNSTFYLWNSTNNLINTTTVNLSGLFNTTSLNYTFVNYTNGTFKWTYRYVREDGSSFDATYNNTLILDSVNPVINNIAPTNGQWFNYNNITLTCNVLTANIGSGFLYGNFTGTWALNQTNSSILTGINNNYYLNLTQGYYKYSCAANKTLSSTVYYSQSGNYTFGIDTGVPYIAIGQLSGTQGSLFFTFNTISNNSFSPISSCKYTIRDKNGVINFGHENTSFICNTPVVSVVGDYGDYTLTAYASNAAGTESSTSTSFTITPTSVVSGGGSGSNNNGVNWTFKTIQGNDKIDYIMSPGSSRSSVVLLKNTGKVNVDVNIICSGNICEYLSLKNNSYSLLASSQDKEVAFEIVLPIKESKNLSQYTGQLIATDSQGNNNIIGITVSVNPTGYIFGLVDKVFGFKQIGVLAVPYILIMLVVFVLSFVFTKNILFSKNQYAPLFSFFISLILSIITIVLI